MNKYFFRIDDVAPNMNWENFEFVAAIFKKYGVKPLIAVIPENKDPKLLGYPVKIDFWQTIRSLRDLGWTVAQHGYRHISSGGGGVLKIHKNGEFGGVDFNKQNAMISAGKKVMEGQEIHPDIFVAPRHSFDKNTVKALSQNKFRFISDGIALWPFKKWGIVWLPQILWRPRKGMPGLITVALHPNTMSIEEINNLEKFIKANREKIGDFSELAGWRDKAGNLKKFSVFFVNLPFKFFWRAVFFIKHGVSR